MLAKLQVEKYAISTIIVKDIMQTGRFLKPVDNGWEIMPKDRARLKVAHALQYLNRKIKTKGPTENVVDDLSESNTPEIDMAIAHAMQFQNYQTMISSAHGIPQMPTVQSSTGLLGIDMHQESCFLQTLSRVEDNLPDQTALHQPTCQAARPVNELDLYSLLPNRDVEADAFEPLSYPYNPSHFHEPVERNVGISLPDFLHWHRGLEHIETTKQVSTFNMDFAVGDDARMPLEAVRRRSYARSLPPNYQSANDRFDVGNVSKDEKKLGSIHWATPQSHGFAKKSKRRLYSQGGMHRQIVIYTSSEATHGGRNNPRPFSSSIFDPHRIAAMERLLQHEEMHKLNEAGLIKTTSICRQKNTKNHHVKNIHKGGEAQPPSPSTCPNEERYDNFISTKKSTPSIHPEDDTVKVFAGENDTIEFLSVSPSYAAEGDDDGMPSLTSAVMVGDSSDQGSSSSYPKLGYSPPSVA